MYSDVKFNSIEKFSNLAKFPKYNFNVSNWDEVE